MVNNRITLLGDCAVFFIILVLTDIWCLRVPLSRPVTLFIGRPCRFFPLAKGTGMCTKEVNKLPLSTLRGSEAKAKGAWRSLEKK